LSRQTTCRWIEKHLWVMGMAVLSLMDNVVLKSAEMKES
jgi:hypothetical protein